MVVELKKGVYWVGAVDWGVRHFHGHELSMHRGTSYNAYLIVDKKTALIDAVGAPFREEFLANLRQVVNPANIDIVVANHAEPDHSGCLPDVMALCPNAQLIVSKRGMESIEGHYHQPWNFTAVQTGDRISLGQNELLFIEASMLHWPDTMFTYLTGHNLLMSNDAFGQHYATSFRFNDQVDQKELYEEALKYYANILTPFSHLVTKKIAELTAMSLPIDMIAPSHGVIWRREPKQIIGKYLEWAAQAGEKRGVVLYDTMWEATRKMAEAIAKGFAAEDVSCKLFPMAVSDRNDVIAEMFKAKAILVGSPTLNNGLLPTILPVLVDLKGLRFKNKIGAAFGSYGWSGECVKMIEDHLADSHVTLVAPGVRAKWQPKPEDLAKCEELGRTVARAVKAG